MYFVICVQQINQFCKNKNNFWKVFFFESIGILPTDRESIHKNILQRVKIIEKIQVASSELSVCFAVQEDKARSLSLQNYAIKVVRNLWLDGKSNFFQCWEFSQVWHDIVDWKRQFFHSKQAHYQFKIWDFNGIGKANDKCKNFTYKII